LKGGNTVERQRDRLGQRKIDRETAMKKER
jgi:hypothetical protein